MSNANYGLNLDDNSTDSYTEGNNFQNNDGVGAQARDDGFNNRFTKNFWADNDNNDTNYDGIADTAYLLDGDAGSADSTASNIPNGLNFYTATMESSPRKLNADSDGTPITLKVYLDDGYRVLDINMSTLWLNRTVNPFDYHIIDILTFTVTFDRAAVNDLVNSLGQEPPFFVTFELFGRINNNLLEITAYDQVEINQTGDVSLILVAGITAVIPVMSIRDNRLSRKLKSWIKKE
jgi:hypothetical protein